MTVRPVALAASPVAGALAVFAASFAWLWLVSPWLGTYQVNPDEGLNLGKAALVAVGHGPYGKMWNDQGPVLTYLLAALQGPFPFDVEAARLLVMASSSLLLAALHVVVRRGGGPLAATVAVVLLAATPFYIQLSSTVMIGLPAISLAVVALAVADRRSPRTTMRAILAGLFFGLALQTKLFTLAMAPALFLALYPAPGPVGISRFRLAGLSALAAALTFALLMIISGQAPFENLVEAHIDPDLRGHYALSASLAAIVGLLRTMPTLLIPGLLGLLALAFLPDARARGLLVPAVWLATAFVALALHYPVHPHQVLLLAVPLGWLGGGFIAGLAAIAAARWPAARPAAAATALVVACGGAAYAASSLPRHAALATAGLQELSARAIGTYAPFGGWVVADMPLAAFRNGLLVPPELVVFSEKRRLAGNLTDDALFAAIEHRRPTQILFQRFPPPPELAARLARDYVVAGRGIRDPSDVHYVARRPDLKLGADKLEKRLTALVDTMTVTATAAGGYATAVDPATGDRFGESGKAIGRGTVWMRPPAATYDVGDRLLRAARATADEDYLPHALEAALAVARAQSCNGGWVPAAEVRGECAANDTTSGAESFDEGLQAGAIGFMLDVAAAVPESPERDELLAASRKGLAFLLATQNDQGAWPQIPAATSGYEALSTLNDDGTPAHIRILLRASEALGDPAYAAAARRGLDFLVAAQLESGGWAQQYDGDLRPRSGRSFEPVAAASVESAYAIAALLEGHDRFGDARYLAAAARAERWLTGAQTDPEVWARFYEIGTNRPIFGDRDGSVHYALAEISEERRRGYDWLGRFPAVIAAIRLVRAAGNGAASYAAEKAAIAEAKRLAQLAHGLGTDRHHHRLDDAGPNRFEAEAWMAAMDDLLAAVEQAARDGP